MDAASERKYKRMKSDCRVRPLWPSVKNVCPRGRPQTSSYLNYYGRPQGPHPAAVRHHALNGYLTASEAINHCCAQRMGINPTPTLCSAERMGINPTPTLDTAERMGINPTPTLCFAERMGYRRLFSQLCARKNDIYDYLTNLAQFQSVIILTFAVQKKFRDNKEKKQVLNKRQQDNLKRE